MQVYSSDAVHAALPWARLVSALESAFRLDAQVPVRHAHSLSDSDTLLLMPAWDRDLVLAKLVTVIPHAEHTVQATVMVLDRRTGAPLAVMDGEAITLRRTAATSALAALHLAVLPAKSLLIVGTGRLAAWMARAYVALVPGIEVVTIWGRNVDAARSLAQVLGTELVQQRRESPIRVRAMGELEAAVRQADLISCATTSGEPLVRGEWLQPGTHLDLVGSFKPAMREADDWAVSRSHVVVDTYAGALSEAGDLVQPLRSGVIAQSHIQAELAEVLRREKQVRRTARDITLFKSVGTALEDLAAAKCVLDLSSERHE